MFETFPDGYLVGDLIVFADVSGGCVSRGAWVEFPDSQASSVAELNQIHDAIAALLRSLPEGWCLQFRQTQDSGMMSRLQEYQQPTASCTNATTRLLRNANFIQQMRRLEGGALWRRRVGVYVGLTLLRARSVSWQQGAAATQFVRALEAAAEAIDECQQMANRILRGIGGRIVPMSQIDHARAWERFLNPSLLDSVDSDSSFDFDPNRSLLDNFWHSEIRGLGRDGICLDDRFIRILGLRRLPDETDPTTSQAFTHLPFGGVITSVQLRRLPREEVLQADERNIQRLGRQQARTPSERQAVTMDQLRERTRSLAGGGAVPFEMHFTQIILERTPAGLAANTAACKSAFRRLSGAQYYEASLSSSIRNLFAANAPGWMWSPANGFPHYVEDGAAADFVPRGTSFGGHPGPVECLFPGRDSNIVNVRTFLGEGASATPQNLVFVGTPGVGKSEVLTSRLIENSYLYSSTGIVEEGLSLAAFTRSFGIEPILPRLDGTQTLPLFFTGGLPLTSCARTMMTALVEQMVGVPVEEDKARAQSALVAEQIARCCDEHARNIFGRSSRTWRSAVVRHAIALDQWAKEHGLSDADAFNACRDSQGKNLGAIDDLLIRPSEQDILRFESEHWGKIRDLVFAYLKPEQALTLGAFRESLLLEQRNEEQFRWLAKRLGPYCRDGEYGVLFDGIPNVSFGGPVIHFDNGALPRVAKELKAVMAVAEMNCLLQRVLALPRDQWKRIVIDEVSRFFELPGADVVLRELFEQFRKYNTQVTIVTQSYSRIADSRIRAAIMGNTRAWLIFNPGDRRDAERLGEDLGLSRAAVETILRLPRPDQQVGEKYSEFFYYHTDVGRPICGVARYVRLPHQLPASAFP